MLLHTGNTQRSLWGVGLRSSRQHYLFCFMLSAQLLQLCQSLCDPMDHSPFSSSVQVILQARILEWVASSSSNFALYSSAILEWFFYVANKGMSSQSYGFSSSHVWMWELDCKESWAPKNNVLNCGVGEASWEFWTARRSNQSTLMQSVLNVHWKDWFWRWYSNTLATWCEETTHWKDPDAGKDWRREEKGTTEDEMIGWHY